MSRLTKEVTEALTFQTYPPAPVIEGVWTRPLHKARSENGAFMEVLRLGEEGVQGVPGRFQPRQFSVSWAEPGRLNAFHLHPNADQSELWCVLGGQLLVWLVDVRLGSATTGIRRSLILSGEAPTLLMVPSGVAHGFRAGSEGATMLYAADQQFDPAQPNEGRLPWDYFGADLWQEDRG